jgi:hypothetical protein
LLLFEIGNVGQGGVLGDLIEATLLGSAAARIESAFEQSVRPVVK